MNKQHILNQIKRTAADNGGKALGRERFEKVSGIKQGEWAGRYWARWSEAVTEAGFAPNQMNSPLASDAIVAQYIAFARQLGRLPVKAEMKMHKRQNPDFPNEKAYDRFGSKQALIQTVRTYCEANPGNEDVAALCASYVGIEATAPKADDEVSEFVTGYVYLALMKVGREKRYKIGKANLVEQRTRQVGVNLPEELELIHAISTDDAYGIEGYWHKRFAEKRRSGEWFELSADDVRVFKRRRFM
jgi:hypothetical protein